MTKKRQKLIDRFQRWLDTDPRKQIIASECATIAEEYAKEQLCIADLKPIPITEDLLIRFGFDLVVKEGNQGEFRVYQLNEITYNTNHGWWWKHQLTVQPKYIHELQNLFFAITGTELLTHTRTKFH